jgi:hypothetical protein
MSQILSGKRAKPKTKAEVAVIKTMVGRLTEPTGVKGGTAMAPRDWIPRLFRIIGVTNWKKKAPQLDQTKALLQMHKWELAVESQEYREALRMEYYLAGYKDRFFQHVINTVREEIRFTKRGLW